MPSRVAGVASPYLCMCACEHMCVCCMCMCAEAGVSVHKQYACKYPCKHPGKEVLVTGRRALLVHCRPVHLAAVHSPWSVGTHSGLAQESAAGGRCVHRKRVHMCRADLGAAPPPFALKAGEHNPSPHPGGREL